MKGMTTVSVYPLMYSQTLGFWDTRYFYKQHFHKQHQTDIGKKVRKN